jgi:hypothetical protein
MAAGPGAKLSLGAGRYRVGAGPGARYALPVSRASGLSVVGDSATVVVSDPALGCLSLSDCDGCKVEGVVVDYDPPPFTETIVTALDPRGRAFHVEVNPGYPPFDAPCFSFVAPGGPRRGPFGGVFDPATRMLKVGLVDNVFLTAAERLGPRSFRLRTLGELPSRLSPGDMFVYLARQYGHALACYRSPRTILRNVHVRAANAVAFAFVQSDAARVAACSVGVEAGSSRLVSANGDGVHCQACRVGPTVEDSVFMAMMDDGLNVYAPPLPILAIPSDARLVVAGTVPIRQGDRLEFSDPVTGRFTGVRRVQAVTRITSGNHLHLRLDAPVPGLSSSARDGVADAAFNLDASGEGYLVRNNRYERHRGHAMRLHTGRGIVEGNRIRHTSRDGILVSNDPDWPEGPNTRDLILQNNTLEGTGGDAAIDVEGRKLGRRLADTATQRHIRIVGNVIRDWRGSAIAVGAAHDVTIRDNRLILSAAEASVADHGVLLERAHAVEIDGLVLRTPAPRALTALITIAPTVASGAAGVRIGDVHAPAGVEAVQDRRAGPSTAVPRPQRSRVAKTAESASRLQ